ncbi:MAG: extracellular solute-binding protein [Candidatus Paceibacterota bacterium]
MRVVFIELAREDDNFTVVRYVEHDSRTFEDDLVNAIAEGRAPDLIIMRDQDLVTYRPKLLAIPYDTLPLRTFKNTYLDGTEIFALSDGIYALPFMVDPLVMYWNRDIFANVGMAEPPTTWEALTNAVQEITLRDATRNILQSTVAFGEYRNVIQCQSGAPYVDDAIWQSTYRRGGRGLRSSGRYTTGG